MDDSGRKPTPNTANQKLELQEADLLGYAIEDLQCTQCGGVFCGCRTGRLYQGKPLIMCTRKDEVKQILSSLGHKATFSKRI